MKRPGSGPITSAHGCDRRTRGGLCTGEDFARVRTPTNSRPPLASLTPLHVVERCQFERSSIYKSALMRRELLVQEEKGREENPARERVALPSRKYRSRGPNPACLWRHVVGRSPGARDVGMSVELAVDLCFRAISRRVRNGPQKIRAKADGRSCGHENLCIVTK